MSRRDRPVVMIDVHASYGAQVSAREAYRAAVAEREASAARERAAAAAQRSRQRARSAAQAPAPVRAAPARPAPVQPPAVETVTIPRSEHKLLIKAANALLSKF